MEVAYVPGDLEAQQRDDGRGGRGGRGGSPGKEDAGRFVDVDDEVDGTTNGEAGDVDNGVGEVGVAGRTRTWKRRLALFAGTFLLSIGAFVLAITLSTVIAEGRRWRSITGSMWTGADGDGETNLPSAARSSTEEAKEDDATYMPTTYAPTTPPPTVAFAPLPTPRLAPNPT